MSSSVSFKSTAHDDPADKYQHINVVIVDYLRSRSEARLRMLDIGCSNGLLGAAVRSELGKDWTIDGVNYNCHALAEAAQRGYRRTIQADLNRQCLQLDGPYDLIIMGDILEHTIDPDVQLRQAAKLLADSGRVVVSLPNIAFFWCRYQHLLGRWEYRDMGIMDRTHLRFFTLDSARELFERNGFVIERMDPFIGVFGRGGFLRSLIRGLAQYKPSVFAPQIVFVLALP